jgi:hypothetical protein
MKTKITYLLLILPLLTFAQGPFNFDTSTEGFTCNSSAGAAGAHTVTQIGGDLSVVFVANQGNNPLIKKADAAINADTNNFIEIRLKNLSAISYLRFAPAGTTANYGEVLISANNAQYQTYTVDVSAWTGAAVGIDILCKKNTIPSGSGQAYTPVAGEYLLIDYIKPLANLVTPEVNVFNFDTDAQGFTNLTRATAVQVSESLNGTLKINCTTANANNGKVALSSLLAHVEGTNKYAHIRLKNTSNTLFQLNGKVSGVATAFNPIQTYTTSDMDYKTYDFDLTTWDNGYQFPELNFGVKTTWSATATYAIGVIVISGNTYCKNTSGANSVSPAVPHTDTTNWVIVNASGTIADASPATNGAILGGALDINALTNSVYVDSIVFDNVVPSALSTTDFGNTKNTISLYPNPANDILNVSSSSSITKIEVYDMQGKKVASNNNASNVNVATLGKGVYIVKVLQENGSAVAKQFIKE